MSKRLLALALSCLALACSEPDPYVPPDPPVDAHVPLPPAPRIDLPSLLDAMIDPLHPSTTLGRFSAENSTSWDRRSRSGPEVPEEWFANDDRNTFVDVREIDGRTEYVMLDTDGPGALVKFWAAGPQGTLRIYLDGSIEPAIEAPMSQLLGGSVEPFTEPFAYGVRHGPQLLVPHPVPGRVRRDDRTSCRRRRTSSITCSTCASGRARRSSPSRTRSSPRRRRPSRACDRCSRIPRCSTRR
ncbi:MAG: hypothetical protein M5U28_49835 [Sandaracinaceae bacterium]|nr:hypothetical protein [Sandaracinaceae bacterium]